MPWARPPVFCVVCSYPLIAATLRAQTSKICDACWAAGWRTPAEVSR